MRRGVKDGIVFGLVGGLILFATEILVAIATGQSPLMPVRMVSSIVLGSGALATPAIEKVVVVGVIVQSTLSAVYGLVCGVINARLWAMKRMTVCRQFAIGLAFGITLWLVNFQIVARVFYPWFLSASQLVQATLHAAFFGLPLTLMLDAAERRHHRRADGTARATGHPAAGTGPALRAGSRAGA